MVQVANHFNMDANLSLGVRIYLVYESITHLPRTCIVASLIPTDAAVVAVPIRNE